MKDGSSASGSNDWILICENLQSGSNNHQYNADNITIFERKVPYETIARWLSPFNPIEHHAAARQQHHEHTGLWLLESDSYQKWRLGESKHLWIYGKPGCGKTVLCSTIIENLKAQLGDCGLAMFYFSFSDTTQHGYHHFLRSVLAQLSHREPAMSALRAAYENSQQIPGPYELQTILHDTAAVYENVYLIVDGLDEIQGNRHEMLTRVKVLLLQIPNLKLLATSREEQSIRAALDDLQVHQISIPYSAITHDIITYTVSQLSTDAALHSFSEKVKTTIQQKIHDTADGMFRWAALLLRELVNLKSTRPSSIQYALKRFPQDLDGIYARILLNIAEHERADARTMLRWVIYSVEPLTLAELAETVIIDTDKDVVSFEDRGSIQDALRLLSSLIVVIRDDSAATSSGSEHIKRSSKIRLAHSTVREYLESQRPQGNGLEHFHLEPPEAHLTISRSCLLYLTQFSLSNKGSSPDHDLFPLLDYAGRSWYQHSAQHMDQTYTEELKFLSNTHAFQTWIRVQEHSSSPNIALIRSSFFPEPSTLYCVCLFGLAPLVDILLDRQHDRIAEDHDLEYALYAASYAGHRDIVQNLIRRGAHVKHHIPQTYSALIAAAGKAHEEIMLTLLDAGADHAVNDSDQSTPLHEAAGNGLYTAVKLLLARRASVSSKDKWGITPLHRAVLGNHIAIIELLLDHGADVNGVYHRRGRTVAPIVDAAGYSYGDAIRLLAERGADISGPDDDGFAPLFYAACSRNIDTMRLLMELGADADCRTKADETVLHYVASHGLIEPMKYLVEHGADISAATRDGQTCLHAAVASGNLECAKFLIACKGDMTATTISGQTLLHIAALSTRQCPDMTQFLLDHGLPVDEYDLTGRTALHIAAYRRASETTEVLLKAGANPSLQDCYGKSALHWLRSDKNLNNAVGDGQHSTVEMYSPTSEQLHKTIHAVMHTLTSDSAQDRSPGWYELGFCFMRLGQDQAAVAALQADAPRLAESKRQTAACDVCNKRIQGETRYKCRQCANVDFCKSCMDPESNGLMATTCSKHKFLAISEDSIWSADQATALKQQMRWLHRLRDAHTHDMDSVGASYNAAVDDFSDLLIGT